MTAQLPPQQSFPPTSVRTPKLALRVGLLHVGVPPKGVLSITGENLKPIGTLPGSARPPDLDFPQLQP